VVGAVAGILVGSGCRDHRRSCDTSGGNRARLGNAAAARTNRSI
jgi:hypothetical protein